METKNSQDFIKDSIKDSIKDTFEEKRATEKIAFITGLTGQDGSFLADFLLEKGYFVYGIVRRVSNINTQRINHLKSNPRFQFQFGNVEDFSSLQNMFFHIESKHPNYKRLEVYHLAAQSHVKVSFEIPIETTMSTALGTLNLLECIRNLQLIPRIRFYNAASSELFGKIQKPRQDETTPFYPQSPYAIAKQCAFWTTKLQREAYGMFACNGILFNHESRRRGYTFVTRKITRFVGQTLSTYPKIPAETMKIGNLEAMRDWSDARDMVRGMWMILQHDKPDDYVLSSDTNHSVREFIEIAFAKKGIKIQWEGVGLHEKGYDEVTGMLLIEVSEHYFRPAEVDVLLGDSTKARNILNWHPEITFDQMINDMLEKDCSF